MMVVEIVAGYATGSMALVADGWHMATHVGALGFASLAYVFSRRFANHPAFAFGTGKVHALAGYTSAVALGFVALAMMGESVSRLTQPTAIDFSAALPVAIVGLVINIASVWLLELREDDHRHEQEHDHNHRAALVQVAADAMTSALAVVALLAGRWLGVAWLDPVTGIVGGVVILKWGVDLCRSSGGELLDFNPDRAAVEEVRKALEQVDDVRVHDLHVWSVGRGRRSCVATIVTTAPRSVDHCRDQLASVCLTHLTIEVRRCPTGGEPVENAAAIG